MPISIYIILNYSFIQEGSMFIWFRILTLNPNLPNFRVQVRGPGAGLVACTVGWKALRTAQDSGNWSWIHPGKRRFVDDR